MAERICERCGTVFHGSPNAHFCTDCLRQIRSEKAKKHNLGSIGREAYSRQQAEKKARRLA